MKLKWVLDSFWKNQEWIRHFMELKRIIINNLDGVFGTKKSLNTSTEGERVDCF